MLRHIKHLIKENYFSSFEQLTNFVYREYGKLQDVTDSNPATFPKFRKALDRILAKATKILARSMYKTNRLAGKYNRKHLTMANIEIYMQELSRDLKQQDKNIEDIEDAQAQAAIRELNQRATALQQQIPVVEVQPLITYED